MDLTKDELIKRYLYLYDNRDLILAMCINYGIKKDFYVKRIKEIKESIKKFKMYQQKSNDSTRDRLHELAIQNLTDSLNEYERIIESNELEPYLYAKVNDEIVNAYEEFLFTDECIENTVLYKHIEALKNDPKFLETTQQSISELEERRKNNQYLRKIPTFTVWKILTYVRNQNLDNRVVLDALDKYYNLDRYILTGINFESGYIFIQTEYESGKDLSVFPNPTLIGESTIGGQYNAIILDYPGNEFEEEDNYKAYYWDIEYTPSRGYAKTNFMYELACMPMLSEDVKKGLYDRIKSNGGRCKK